MINLKYFRMLVVLCAAVVALFGSQAFQANAASSQWEAQYYNNRTLSGEPKYVVTESSLNQNWGHGKPFHDLNKDAFSVRWLRTVGIPTTGTYRLTATMDDGMRVWVDNVLVIDSWTDSQEHSVSNDVFLTAGDHNFKVEYYEAGGVALAKLDWTLISANAIAPNSPVTIYNWRGEYFNNLNVSGQPVLIRDDSQINFDCGVNSPASNLVSSDNFSVRWTRNVPFAAGSYRFTLTADDGVRLWVDGVPVIDQWKETMPATYTAELYVRGGDVPVRMEYFDKHGGAIAKLSWVQTGSAPVAAQPTGVWYAEYFNNKQLSGSPLSTRNESVIDFNWGYGSPVPNVVNVDNFSARWTRMVELPAGTYRFTATADDGIRLYVNNVLVINAWSDHAVQTYTADVTVSGGTMPIRVEYYDSNLLAEARVSWVKTTTTAAPPQVTSNLLPEGQLAVVNTGALNVRTGPGVDNPAVNAAVYKEVVTLTGFRANVGTSVWVSIKKSNGTTGWVNSRYLNTSYPINTLTLWP